MNKPWPLHTVVFDLDDTLFAERDYVLSGFAAVDAWLATQLGPTEFLACATRYFEEGGRGNIFDRALATVAPTAPTDIVARMLAVYRAHTPKLTLGEDARVCLNGMRGRFRLALLSDGYLGVQQNKFSALGLADRFQCVVFTDALGRENWKPSRMGFERIMAELPGVPAGYVYVADNPRKDFIAPRALGWRTVRIRRSKGEHRDYEPAAHEAAEMEIGALKDLCEQFHPAE